MKKTLKLLLKLFTTKKFIFTTILVSFFIFLLNVCTAKLLLQYSNNIISHIIIFILWLWGIYTILSFYGKCEKYLEVKV